MKQTIQQPKKSDAVEKMLKTKRSLVARLKKDIAFEQEESKARVAKIEGRVRQAEVLIDALEKGSLKP